jgi:subtilisin family serine protease/putative cell wall-binding protein
MDANGFPYRAGEILVKFEDGLSTSAATSAHKTAGATKVRDVSGVKGLQLARANKGASVEALIRRYEKIPGVAYAAPNYLHHIDAIPTDPRFEELWGMDNQGQTGGTEDADIDAPEAWDIQTGDGSVVVAVIDTGVDYRHPDLEGNMWTNPGEIPGNGIDDDGNGYVDDVYGYDFFNYDSDPLDDHSHGTHCSGTIGATANDGIGVAGVAWDVQIMAVKFLSADGWGDTIGAVESIYYADMMGADIMSNSWGGGPWEQILFDAISGTDALFVAAAGNDSMDTDWSPNYPSCYDSPNVLAVGATDHNDQMAWFSNWGAETVDVFAPGEEILSTVAGPVPVFTPDSIGPTLISDCTDIGDWDTSQYEENPWALTTDEYVSAPSAIAHFDYQDDEDSWIVSANPVDLSGMAGAALNFQAYYDTEDWFDTLNVWVSPDGSNWTSLAMLSGYSGGWRELTYDMSSMAGDSDVWIAFSFVSDDSIDSGWGFTGVAVDDVSVVEIDPVFSDRFDDLSNWDTGDYAQQAWDLQTDWYTSEPSAAGNLSYMSNESAWLTLDAPGIDMSGVTGDAAITAQLFYDIEWGFDTLQVMASADGADWTPLAGYTGWSGMWDYGFRQVTIDVSDYAGVPALYLAFVLESDEIIAGDEGLLGVAVDDISILEGTWSEADYDSAYDLYSGTSMATPHVSGIAALMLSERAGKSAEQIKNAIIKSADYLPQLDGTCVSSGRANASSALGDLYPPDVTDNAKAEYVARADIKITASDESGIGAIYYAFDDDEPTMVEASRVTAVNTVPAWHTLTYWAEDTIGNVSDPVTVEFRIRRGDTSSVEIAGSNRYATSVAASVKSFPNGCDTVVIATGENWPDALGGAALAGAVDGPVLLTTPGAMPAAVRAEVDRLGASQAYILGGTAAVSSAVEGDLATMLGFGNVMRLEGSNRYATASKIAEEVIAIRGDAYDGMSFVASGESFADALAAAPISRYKAWPVLLANPNGDLLMPEEISSAVILGGTKAVSEGFEAALDGLVGDENVIRKGGSDRYATAALVSAWSISKGMYWEGVGIATGEDFADALSGGAMLGKRRSVMLLTPGDTLMPITRAPLSVNRRSIQTVHFIGGPAVVSPAVRAAVMDSIE